MTHTLITKLDEKTHARLDQIEFPNILLRNGQDVRDAIRTKWGVEVERTMPRSYKGGGFIFNVYLTQ